TRLVNWELMFGALIVGSAIGAVMAIKIPMTGMPQMVGLLNGFGGGASALVALAEYYNILNDPVNNFIPATTVTIILGILIGGVTFTGSFIAFGKLQGFVSGKV